MAEQHTPLLDLGTRKVGNGHPTFVIAEMSANHNQDLGEAKRIIDAAAKCGADGIKLQTYTADTMTIDSDRPEFLIGPGTVWEGKRLHALYDEAHTPWDWHPILKEHAEQQGLIFFSTPFDDSAVDFLESLEVSVYKIASFELVDIPLLRKVASTGKPIIASTGMASEAEIAEAVETLRACGASQIALLKCTSAYPAPPESMNLTGIPYLSERFGVVSGLSDHTLGPEAPIAAVALGARIIEKHFTLSRAEPGPDSGFSLEPAEFAAMTKAIRTTERALGVKQDFGPTEIEKETLVFRRSLFVVQDVLQGEEFTGENIRAIRPGYGLAPKHLDDVVGTRAACNITRGTPLSWEQIQK